MSKGLRHSIPSQTSRRATKKLGHVFVDLSGLKYVAALGKKRHVALFRDDCSRFLRVYFLVQKSSVAWAPERFLADTRLDVKVEILRADDGGDFQGIFSSIDLRYYRIKRELVMPHSPMLNDGAERDLELLEVTQVAAHIRAASLLGDVKMPNSTYRLWAEAMNWACDAFI